MKLASVRSVCVLALLYAVIGCSEDGTGAAGGTGGVGGMAGVGGSAITGEVRTYLFFFGEYDPDALPVPPFPPLEDVRVCEADTDNCATTDSLGNAALDVPANQAVAFTMEKEGYGSWIHGDVSDENFGPAGGGRVVTLMYTDAQLEEFATQLETTYPWTNGMVALVRWPPRSGVTFAPAGPTVDAVGDLFYYDVASEEYRRDLEATTTTSPVGGFEYLPLAEGGFVDVTPGVHEFEFGGNVEDCTRTGWAWPGDGPNRIRAPVRAGFTTYASIICDE